MCRTEGEGATELPSPAKRQKNKVEQQKEIVYSLSVSAASKISFVDLRWSSQINIEIKKKKNKIGFYSFGLIFQQWDRIWTFSVHFIPVRTVACRLRPAVKYVLWSTKLSIHDEEPWAWGDLKQELKPQEMNIKLFGTILLLANAQELQNLQKQWGVVSSCHLTGPTGQWVLLFLIQVIKTETNTWWCKHTVDEWRHERSLAG